LIYASHVIEYFDINEVKEVLREWRRVLKPGGELRVAVPDFEAMNILYHNGKVKLEDIIGPLYGRMPMGGSRRNPVTPRRQRYHRTH
jgi:ubiquinone/menaquinone biosynthesis C-methylase UbiE